MLQLAWKTIRHNPKRLILTTVAIVLATMFVSGTFILTNGIQNSFNSMFDEIYGQTDIIVRPVDDNSGTSGFSLTVPSFDESLTETIAGVEGVDLAVPEVSGPGVLITDEGTAQMMGPPTILMNWSDQQAAYNLTIVDGHAPQNNNEVVLDVDAAKRAGYEVGDIVTFTRFGESEEHLYLLAGIARFGEANALNGATLAFFTYDEAQMLARQEGKVATVYVTVSDGYDVDSVLARIQSILPDDVRAQLSKDVVAEAQSDVASAVNIFNVFILAFAVIAVFVGAMLITNTFQTIVTQRTRELGLLRAIAASPRQILSMILLEAAIIGLIGSTLGLALGYGLATVIKILLTAFAGMGENLGALTIPWTAPFWGIVTGLGTTLVAAVLPAIHASSISPMEALRDEAARTRRGLSLRTMVGAMFFSAGVLSLIVGFATDIWSTVWWSAIAGGTFLIGTILTIAIAVRPLTARLQGAFRKLFGLNGTLALRNAAREPRRTANTAGALMIGVLLLSLITTVAASLKSTVTELLTGTTTAEFVVSGDLLTDPLAPISDIEVRQMEHVDGVTAVHTWAWDEVTFDHQIFNVDAVDIASAEAAYRYNTDPEVSTLDRGEVFVNQSILDRGSHIGDTITLTGVDASLDFVITGKYSEIGGSPFLMDIADAKVLHKGLAAMQAYVVIDKSADIEEVRAGLERAVSSNSRLVVNTTSELSKIANDSFNQLLAVLAGMLSMSLVIAIFGLANTLYLSVAERTREIGLLRAVGISRKGVNRMIRLESVFISILGAVCGLALGVGVAVALVNSFEGLDELTLTIPWLSLAIYTVLAMIAGVLAALLPAYKASNLNILEAVTTE